MGGLTPDGTTSSVLQLGDNCKVPDLCANAEHQGKLKAGLGLTNLAAALAKRVKFGPS